MWHQSMGLTMRKICGELECPEYYMCQSHDLQCYPCHSYCNQSSHNFDAHICERQCQDYIHDYIKHYVKAEEIQDSLQEKEILQFLLICVMVLIIITLVLISIMTVLICNRKRLVWTIENEGEISSLTNKTDFSKLKDNEVSLENETVDNPMTMMAVPTRYMTPSSSNKFPCEDITLETQDFTGYDNLGMWKVSPELCSKL
ncbi:protein grindelwald [Metopolophium dirhodum]|uniref:protein grindelwald n=1 Tax=Metopolophium dirhodum TaxID=44670 RepID=UPI0029906519|nr:protein grindelwald [Metopolophium dirhodum]